MSHRHGEDRPRGPSLQNVLRMLLSSNRPTVPASEDNDLVEDVDEPPDNRLHQSPYSQHPPSDPVYVKSPTVVTDNRKESLLTRALMGSPDLSASAHDSHYNYYLHSSNISGPSTAELTSDGDLTSPALSNASSPPLPSHFTGLQPTIIDGTAPPKTGGESVVEASLGRKRCISFACGRKPTDDKSAEPTKPQPQTQPQPKADSQPAEPPKRKCALTFACPTRSHETRRQRSSSRTTSLRSRPRPSPAPTMRRAQTDPDMSQSRGRVPPSPKAERKQRGIPTSGLGGFEPSEETRFHEFASSEEEVDEWVKKDTPHGEKITLNDCLRKENAIRKLGEEAEAEALQDEEDEAEAEDEEMDDDDTVHDFSSDDDDGNESDNEAGFADSDDDSDCGSEYRFWAPSTTTAATSADNLDLVRQAAERRNSNTSLESLRQEEYQKWLPAPAVREKGRRPSKPVKMRPGTPSLPDSTDFVCGTLDEDRPLEAAYKSCLEQRRLSKHVPIPQDIDPSFPTTDPEDNEDDFDDEDDLRDVEEDTAKIKQQLVGLDEESLRGRQRNTTRKMSPRLSPRRPPSPAPRVLGHSPKRVSPKRLRSPAPPPRIKSPAPISKRMDMDDVSHAQMNGVNITGLVQRPYRARTKSLPRTPNPFFTSLENAHKMNELLSSARDASRPVEMHNRGPIDIVEGLEKKRQKRKEKYWRQHCRKAAKEQMERRPLPGKGAERMKELGLEVAERFRAYGVGQDAQLVLSV
ncbi:hypothetical protein DTO212C5_5887 [Paecilomyces variotii]|nr:hypothetical protein DTO212C5_5887 [Paecilomyces variotii]